MHKVNVDGLLSSQALFRHISPSQLEQLRQDVVRVEVEKGKVLFRKGEVAEGAYVVVFGLVKLSVFSMEGTDKVLELIRPGQTFGEAMACLAQGLSNKEIARQLEVAERTVTIHVQNILKKLKLSSRVQIAVYAVERELGK